MLFILEGEITITWDDNNYVCGEKRMVLLAYNKEYRIMALTPGTMLVLNFTTHYHVCDHITTEQIVQAIRNVNYSFNTLEMRAPILRLVQSVVFYLEHNIYCKYLYDAKSVELSSVYTFFYNSDELVNFFYPVLYKELTFSTLVKNNYERARTVQELAKLCKYSLSNFKKIFVRHFGISPYQWMLQQKASKIKSRLLDKTFPIKAIAAEFGFADQSHLNSYCKRYFNATPLQIRNRHKE